MSRRREISSDIWEDLKISKLTIQGRLLFIGIITLSNDYGKLRADPELLRIKIFPYDFKIKIQPDLELMNELGMIIHYQVKGEWFIKIPKWSKHQTLKYKGRDDYPNPVPIMPVSEQILQNPAYSRVEKSRVEKSREEEKNPSKEGMEERSQIEAKAIIERIAKARSMR